MKIRFVGGPFDGDEKECSGCSTYLVPDSADIAHYVREDGTVGMLFGQHTYELKWNVRVGADGNREDQPRYEYVGYEKPKASKQPQNTEDQRRRANDMTTPQNAGEPSVASSGSKPLTFGSLFAGIGGFDLGLERAGMRCEWQVEIDPYARAVLAKHWPDVRRHEDVRTFPPQEGEWGVDVICGGFPCQDISVAGKGAGLAGARSGLWYEYARIIGELRPRYVIVENVAALLARGMGTVLGDLSSLGYDAEWHVIPASAVGAPHRRDRIWIVAHAVGAGAGRQGGTADEPRARRAGKALRQGNGQAGADRLEPASATASDVPDAIGFADAVRGDGAAGSPAVAGRRLHAAGSQRNRGTRCAGQAGQGACDVADSDCLSGPQQLGHERRDGRPGDACGGGIIGRGSEGDGWWSVEPDVGRVAHGVPARVDRLRCLGNAVVPQIVEVIGRAIVEAA